MNRHKPKVPKGIITSWFVLKVHWPNTNYRLHVKKAELHRLFSLCFTQVKTSMENSRWLHLTPYFTILNLYTSKFLWSPWCQGLRNTIHDTFTAGFLRDRAFRSILHRFRIRVRGAQISMGLAGCHRFAMLGLIVTNVHENIIKIFWIENNVL